MNAGRPSTIWRWANAGPSRPAPTWCRSVLPRTGCAWSATGRSSPSIPATPTRRSQRIDGRIASSQPSELMTLKHNLSATIALAFALAAAAPASAANKEHQQLMADLRILQEQAQLLQNTLDALNESMKAMDGRMTQRVDQLSTVLIKAFADQKLSLDNLSNDVRVIREKLDDNNVRIGSLTQEVNALRQSLQQLSARPAVPSPEPDAAAGSTAPAVTPTNAAPIVPPGASPQKYLEAAMA